MDELTDIEGVDEERAKNLIMAARAPWFAQQGTYSRDMAQTTIKHFAEQIGIPPDKLLQQLVAAGVEGKNSEDILSDEEKMTLLSFLRTHHGAGAGGAKKITLRQKSTSQVKQSTRFGQARTVQVEVRKKRTFVKRTEIEEAPISVEEVDEMVAAPIEEAVLPAAPAPAPEAVAPVEPSGAAPVEAAKLRPRRRRRRKSNR